jgi:hypothetical protein
VTVNGSTAANLCGGMLRAVVCSLAMVHVAIHSSNGAPAGIVNEDQRQQSDDRNLYSTVTRKQLCLASSDRNSRASRYNVMSHKSSTASRKQRPSSWIHNYSSPVPHALVPRTSLDGSSNLTWPPPETLGPLRAKPCSARESSLIESAATLR